jgi:hypothetical protein
MSRPFRTIVPYGLLVAACGSSPAGPAFQERDSQDGLLEGVVDGSMFRGTGGCGGTADVRMGWGGNFQFVSHGVGKSEDQSIFGIWHDGVIPPAGSYTVERPGPFQRGFWLFYSRMSRDGPATFAAYTGTIEIDASSSSEVRGSFHVLARPTCGGPTCPDPTGFTGEETIELSGTFRLVPRSFGFEPL